MTKENSNTETEKKNPSLRKRLWGLFTIIFLGALGSGLWENFLSPFLLWLFKIGSDLTRKTSTSFIDSVYQDVSNGFHEESSVILYITFWTIIACCYITMFLTSRKIASVQEKTPQKISIFIKTSHQIIIRNRFYSFSIIVIFAVIVSLFYISRTVYVNTTITKTLSNIEIISKVIDEREYRKFKSDFYSITCEKDYLKLKEDIFEIGKQNNLKLKD